MVQTGKIQSQAKAIFKDIDLYGIDLLMETLKQYPFISWRDKTVPNEGSPSRLVSQANIKTSEQIKKDKGINFAVNKLILHRNGSTTIATNLGFYQFFACGGQNLKIN